MKEEREKKKTKSGKNKSAPLNQGYKERQGSNYVMGFVTSDLYYETKQVREDFRAKIVKKTSDRIPEISAKKTEKKHI